MGTRWRARFGLPRRHSVVLAEAHEVPGRGDVWDDAPTAGLHCLFCHSSRPAALHRLDDTAAMFRDADGFGYVLPRFVPVCHGCERLSAEGMHAVLAQLIRVQNPYEDEADNIVATFHLARRESRPILE